MKINSNRISGFTLIEIMVVVVIMSILASIVVPKIMSRPEEARIAKASQDLRAIGAALDLYRLDNFTYPTTDQGLAALVTAPGDLQSGANWKKGGYLERVPKDPWGNDYLYLAPGSHGEYDLYSWGADGASGGSDSAADINSWELY
ncbi:MAG: type II secretion system major pseudopilin GspG [Gammaproteobacteria bacterium]|nr:type II secretion system major pseudopilin GspG [Gammaproteobacteria bacterium]NNJ92083.1 type II secretion system major pseudopilin GspG [Gammaproteobacteria bacterium]